MAALVKITTNHQRIALLALMSFLALC